ncbi:MAG TPA: tRNA (adenosine(37)-N6)-threonylcarbamoyltransferase complex ATPase subunit type 1 TsaE [Steroidobacteraceae bacterium]|nr:tRNA (adenosine(37)-N6)-threonylcarbamoyltransferase complex ATPase subunit type 1 TsaE [Steroidobacteraceae bacterium]
MSLQFIAAGADGTRELGARLAVAWQASEAAARVATLVTLSGDLGAGKTTFAAGLLQALGHAGPVRSPTYTLIEPYRFGARDVHHCDLYRLRHPQELDDLGLRDLRAAGSLLLVEWPEKAEGRLGAPDLAVTLRYAGDAARELSVDARSEVGRDVLVHL